MEDDPLGFFIQDKSYNKSKLTRASKVLSKRMKINPISGQLIKPDPRPGQQIKRLINNIFLLLVPFEIELPGANRVGNISLLIGDTQTDLD